MNNLVWLVFCHLIGDYVMQSDFLANTKGKNWYHLIVHCMETVDAVPVVHGRWVRFVEYLRHHIEYDMCSVCGFKYGGIGVEHFRYCPNCGAKMGGGAE